MHYVNNVLASTDNIYYTYDVDGALISMNYNGEEYFYVRNLQQDIIALIDISGNIEVEYEYDAWGNIIHQTNNTLAKINPYRYRGYRFDEETKLNYLNSRYYNPEIGRFINADGLIGSTGDLLGHNMYAYCQNNPIMMVDPSGYNANVIDGPWPHQTDGGGAYGFSGGEDSEEESLLYNILKESGYKIPENILSIEYYEVVNYRLSDLQARIKNTVDDLVITASVGIPIGLLFPVTKPAAVIASVLGSGLIASIISNLYDGDSYIKGDYTKYKIIISSEKTYKVPNYITRGYTYINKTVIVTDVFTITTGGPEGSLENRVRHIQHYDPYIVDLYKGHH